MPEPFAPGIVFGLTGIGGAVLGTQLNRGLDEDVLLLGFAGLMLFVAATMARRLLRPAYPTPDNPSVPQAAAEACAGGPPATALTLFPQMPL